VARALIVGSGLAAATTARVLGDAGVGVEVVEAGPSWGGQLRPAEANGVLYEPHGAHIFHTTDTAAWDFVRRFASFRPYRHRVMTEVQGRLLSWPPQVAELQTLAQWPGVRAELDALPAEPDATNFETWCVSVMGATLYDWFIEPYTRKQWDCEPSSLTSKWAPRRIELRDDGYTDLFRDPHQGWPVGGYGTLIDGLLKETSVTMGVRASADDIADWVDDYDAVLVTAPLDELFAERLGPLPWRGVHLVNRYVPGVDHVLPCGVVNHPGLDQPYTRRIETKWMSGQEQLGTVVSQETPGAPVRHYPVDDVEGDNRRLAQRYQQLLREEFGPTVFLAGRLATYTYINMDQAVRQGLNAAAGIMRQLDTAAA